MKRSLTAIAMMGVLWGGVAEAQERATDGERVRLEYRTSGGQGAGMMEGWLVRIHPGDSIVVATRIDRQMISFRTPLVDRFQVYRVKNRGTRGAILGTIGAGLLVFPFTEAECSNTRSEVCFGRGTVLYAAGGFLLGSLIGSFMEVPTWVDVAPESFRVPSIRPALTLDGGLGFFGKLALRN